MHRKIAALIEEHFDAFWNRLKAPFGKDSALITPYLGYVASGTLYLHGRVLRNKRLERPSDTDTIWENILNMYRRFNTDEVAGAQIEASVEGRRLITETGQEGFFTVTINLPAQPGDTNVDVTLRLLQPEQMSTTGRAVNVPPQVPFGIISDLDDTVVRSDAYHLLKLARNTFLHNAHTRLPFAGVAAFYRALTTHQRPIFYVSNSPWNLYDLFVDFFQIRNIPMGPLFLQDVGLPETLFSPPGEHKFRQIQTLFDHFPDLPFILIGDSGQHDPEIYAEMIRRNRDRVLAVYIRDVSDDTRDTEILEIAAKTGVDTLLVEDTLQAAEHAHARGFINAADLDMIQQETAADTSPPTPIEDLTS